MDPCDSPFMHSPVQRNMPQGGARDDSLRLRQADVSTITMLESPCFACSTTAADNFWKEL